MKNIFLIPTSMESRLWRDLDSNKLTFENLSKPNSNECTKCSNEYVYITSDEYIGLNWYLDGDLVRKGVIDDEDYWSVRKDYKKIVMTNDPKLIEDGVQQIGDLFFRWFVLNPTCEEVEIGNQSIKSFDTGHFEDFYKIIPKEERKKNFYCGDEVDYGEQCDFQCERCVNCTGVDYGYLPKEDLGYTTKIGIKVVDGMVRPLMVPKKYFGEEKVYNNSFHYQTRWLLDFLSEKDYLTDKREVIEKEFEEYLKK